MKQLGKKRFLLIAQMILTLTLTVSISDAAPTSAPIATRGPTIAATPGIYKHVDAQGNISYSDTPPNAAAETLELEPLGTITMPKAAKYAPAEATAAPFAYQSITITSPANGRTFQNLNEPLLVSAQVSPPLENEHIMELLMDGRALTVNGLVAQVENIERGSHIFTAQVRDAVGKVLITSSPVTIYAQRYTINSNTKKNTIPQKPSIQKPISKPLNKPPI